MTQALAQRPKSGGSKPPIPQRPKSGSKPRPSSAAAAKPKVVKPDLIEALKTGGLQQYAVRNRPLPRRSSPPPPPASAQSAASRTPCFGDRAITHTVSHVPEPCTTTTPSLRCTPTVVCCAHPPSSDVHTHRRLLCTPTVVCCAWQRKLEDMGLVGVAQIVKMRRAQVDELIEQLRPLPGHRLRLLNLFEEQRAYATRSNPRPG